jgi:hypothetical protein
VPAASVINIAEEFAADFMPEFTPDRRQWAFLCDIDGTLAKMHGGDEARGPFDWDRVGEDLPNEPVIRVIRAVKLVYPVIFASGRMEQCRDQTHQWIRANVCDHSYACFCRAPMWLRANDDFRPDQAVKREMYDLITERYRVMGVFDDRLKVIHMWRELGLTVFDVAGYEQ